MLISKFLLSVSFYFILFTNIYSQSGWINQISGVTTNLNSVKFVNSQTGWCVGDSGKILKTTNGGLYWNPQFSGFHYNLRALNFPSIDTGYIAGDSGIFLKTINGGDNWFRLNSVMSKINFSSVFFLNNNEGYLGGNYSKLFRTTNGGVDWDSIDYEGDFIKSIFFINIYKGWIINGYYILGTEQVKKTYDGGLNWIVQYGTIRLNSIFFIDSFIGWTVGYGSTYRTKTGGDVWSQCILCNLGEVSSVFFINDNIGWLTSYGSIRSTTNGGSNWVNYPNLQNTQMKHDIVFTDSLTGWVVGDSGTILKTTTGGILTDFTNISSEIPEDYSLSQNFPNPFNPRTIINYQLSMFSFVSIKVYDVLGNEVAELVNEKQNAGYNSVEFDGSGFASGIYFYRLEIDGNIIDSKRMILLK
ncbi:MAG TPA: YCF48-related protein [Ignavibacteria bacterium]|nr:YCF48-related protein [Ignavibacteria bacterium]